METEQEIFMKEEENDEMEKFYENEMKKLKVDTIKLENNIQKLQNSQNELIILIESGSFAPPHKMHVGLMEKAKKYIEENYNNRKVVGGFIIPSSDQYVKHKLGKDFISLKHRINMTNLIIKDNDWLESLDWGWAYGEEIKEVLDRILKKKFPYLKNIKTLLVFGIDYYLRNRTDMKNEHVCVYRPGYDIQKAKAMYPQNLIFVEGEDEDINSTSIRKAIKEKNEEIIKKLTNEEVYNYIKNNDVFN